MNDRVRLVLLSFLMLFVELALIRWTGSNVVYLSYFSNFVLLGSFLGIGLGFLRAHRDRDLFPWAPVALALLVAFVYIFPVEIDRSGSQLIYFGDLQSSGLPTWATLPIIFLFAAGVMAMIAEGVARVFARFEPLEAYRLDIMGSLAGIIAFSALSFLHAPPIAWGVITAGVFVIVQWRSLRAVTWVALFALVLILGRESLLPGLSWSPYYKVAVYRIDEHPDRTFINVNGIPHQDMQPVEERERLSPIYFKPYERAADQQLDRVLIIGAGNGTDVAIALQQGASHVDAVEIDPRLQQLGAELHPDDPYGDPRVDVFIDDGRSFLERTAERYDLILFALPDSLTLVAGQSSLRLESFLFTREAMEAARSRLAADGVFSMYNYYRQRWLVDRLANTMRSVFGHPPCIDEVGRQGRLAVLSAGSDVDDARCGASWRPITESSVISPATDDHPFLYLKENEIPGFYLLTIGLILLVSLGLVRLVTPRMSQIVSYGDLFLMGAAFLLLEAKSVVQFALLFGTTWFVNALVFAGVLVSVLAAVDVARRFQFKNPKRLYLALTASLLIAWALPPGVLLEMARPARFIVAIIVSFTPIFLANLIFAERFRRVSSSPVAFGANLLGAMVGGVLEYTALVVGYRMILVVVAVLYLGAFLLTPRGNRAVLIAR